MGRRAPDQSVDAVTAALQQAQPLIRDSAMRELQYARDRERFMSEPLTAEPASGGVSAPREIYGDELVAAMVVVALLLLIACINVANLLLVRAAGRRQEFGIRRALGASRLRLIRQLLAEGALLSSAGVLLGLLSGLWISRVLARQLSVEFMMSGAPLNVDLDLALDWRLLLFASVLGAITTLLFATAPAWSASRVDPNVSLAEQRRGFVGGSHRDSGHVLVLGQIALSLILLVACGLLLRSFYGLVTTRLGFAPSRVLVVNIDSRFGMIGPGRGFATLDPANAVVAFGRFREAVEAAPGVAAAAWSVTLPINGSYLSGWVEAPGMEGLSRDEREVYVNLVTPGWFDTLGTRLIAGRDVDARDRFGAPRVAVVNEAFARKFFGGANPVGHVIRGVWPDPQENTDPLEIVGLVEDAVYRSIKEPVPETVYQPIAQIAHEDVSAFGSGLVLIARPATATPTQISRGVAAAIVTVDPEVSLTMRPLEVQVRSTFNNERVLALLAAVFAGLALLLVAVGIYGVISHAVTRRHAEIGLRIALGAAECAVVRLVVGRVTLRVVGGLALGALASLWTARFIESLLFGVTARDLRTLGGAAVILLTVASAAALTPARRATKVDPAQALRQE